MWHFDGYIHYGMKKMNYLEYPITSNIHYIWKSYPTLQISTDSQYGPMPFINILTMPCVCDFEHPGMIFLKTWIVLSEALGNRLGMTLDMKHKKTKNVKSNLVKVY